MDLQEFIKEKRELELSIGRLVQAAIWQFEQKTGQSPTYVSISGVEKFSVDEMKPRYLISDVQVEVPIK